MRSFGVLASALGLVTLVSSNVRAASECDTVLRPNIEQINSDYSIMQAYMRENAGFEFDRLQKLDKSEREADATYKFFSAEYSDPHSREEFKEKVRDRLEKESFRMDLTETKALSRTYVTDNQIEEWGKCISSGALLLVASGPNSTAFPLKVSWVPPKGTGEDRVWITVDGGKIRLRRGREVSDITEKYIGRTTKAYIVKPAGDSKKVVITAFIHGDGEAISVNLEHQKVPAPPPPARTYIAKGCDRSGSADEAGSADAVCKSGKIIDGWCDAIHPDWTVANMTRTDNVQHCEFRNTKFNKNKRDNQNQLPCAYAKCEER